METKRPPALTSPWKIGFLVSLLLIFLGIGVNYILFRTFNLSWTCFGFDQGKFFFLKNAFFNEMAPIIAIIVFASMVAYFLITAAVRKYKTYLDSGHDYRNLIHVIEEIKDLDDEKVVQRLNKYPKLRDFLKGIRDQVQKKEKALKDRENALNDREKRGMAGGLEQECISSPPNRVRPWK